MFETGAATVRVVGGPAAFYERYQTTTLYVERVFGNSIGTLTISNDSTTDTVNFSYDGATIDGSLGAGESITLNTNNLSSVYICGVAGGGYARIWGW